MNEPVIRYCAQRHIYDASVYAQCPYCKKILANQRKLAGVLSSSDLPYSGEGEEHTREETLLQQNNRQIRMHRIVPAEAVKHRVKRVIRSVLSAVLLLLVMGSGAVWGLNTDDLQSSVNGNELVVYLPQQDYRDTSVRVQVGSTAVLEGDLRDVDGNGSIQTLILFDNSLSISPENRQKMKQVVRTIVEKRTPEEQFAFATFDTGVHMLTEMKTDVSELLPALEAVDFQNQYTWLKTCLYGCIGDPSIFTEGSYARILICSDGCDDNPTGYTADEVRRKLQQYPCEVLAVGSVYDREPEAVSRLFSLAGSRQTCTWLLDDFGEDISAVTEGICAEKPGKVAVVTLDDRLLDGEEKRIQVQTVTGEGTFSGTAAVVMPFSGTVPQETETGSEETAAISSGEETETALSVSEADVSAAPEEEPGEEPEEKPEESVRPEEGKPARIQFILFPVLLLIPLAALTAALVLLSGRRKKQAEKPSEQTDRPERTFSPADRPEWTVSQTAADPAEDEMTLQQNMMEDDESTVLIMNDSAGAAPGEICRLTLASEDNPRQVYSVPVSQEVIIGRRPECTIALEGDPSVSGHHCVIYRVGDDIMLRDDNSSNGTWLNHQKLSAPQRIGSGDVIGIGRTRWKATVYRGQR